MKRHKPEPAQTIITQTAAETRKIAFRLAGNLKGGETIALSGPLGAGKTVFVKGLARGLGIPEREVRSPSFVILMEHTRGRLALYHFDFYRFTRAEEVESIPFAECRRNDGVRVIEWPERVAGYLPEDTIRIVIKPVNRTRREISFSGIAPPA